MMIPLVDLKAQYQSLKAEIDSAIEQVLESGQYVLGEEVAAFEREFAESCGVKFAVGVNSGTSALQLALLAAGVERGDEVITVPFTFVATAAAIDYVGARPVFVDIDRYFTIDVAQIERAITPRTKAIVPVHLYGQPADMTPLLEIARRRRLVVIEDAAQAHAATYDDRPVGSFGHLACFSFYPSKNLGAFGDAGAVVTNDETFAERVRSLRSWGEARRYEHTLKGFNYRMAAVQGAILRVKLRQLNKWTEARREKASLYDSLLRDSGIGLPPIRPGARHVYHTYTVRLPQREALRAKLQEQQIQTAIHYPIPIHLQPAFAGLGHRPGDFPRSEEAAGQVLSLPMYPELSDDQVARVAAVLKSGVTVPAT